MDIKKFKVLKKAIKSGNIVQNINVQKYTGSRRRKHFTNPVY
jgi:hypothetical protein